MRREPRPIAMTPQTQRVSIHLHGKTLWACLLVFLTAMALAAVTARAAEEEAGGSFLTPFPEGDVYQIAVVGDTFAEGLLQGLSESFAGDGRVNIQKRMRPLDGIMTAAFDEKVAALEKDIAAEPAHAVIVMVGEDDRVQIKSPSGRKVAIMSAEWRAEYARRLDRVMKVLRVKNAGIYWAGLPNLGRDDANEQAAGMNEVIRERAYQNGFRYVDIYGAFVDESGAYSAYGPDLAGKIRVLRQGDGVHFTDAGNRKLAHFVERELRRDLNQAKSERNIPLAGNEAEQAAINPENTVKLPAPTSPVAADPAADAVSKASVLAVGADADPSGEQKAESGKIKIKAKGAGDKEEMLALDVVRPAIPATVVALMARREAGGQTGDLVVDEIGGGLTLMTSVMSSGQKGRGKTSPSQAPYFRLLVKGERLQPKPGRADDFSWTKPDATNAGRTPAAPKG